MTKTAAKKTSPAPKDAPAAVPNPYCADGCGARVNGPKSTFLQGHDQRLISDLSYRVVNGEMGAFQRALLTLVEDPKPSPGAYHYDESGDIMDRINAVSAAVSARFSTPLAAKFTSAAMAKWDKSVRRSNTEAARVAHREAKAAAKAAKKAGAESPQTKAVFRHLQASADGRTNTPIGATLDLSTKDAFWADAVAHLGDNSNLKTATIKAADWDQVYAYFVSGLVSAETPKPDSLAGVLVNTFGEGGLVAEVETPTTVGQEVPNLRGTLVKAKIGRWTYDATVVGMNQKGKVTAVEYLNKKGDPITTDKFTLVK